MTDYRLIERQDGKSLKFEVCSNDNNSVIHTSKITYGKVFTVFFPLEKFMIGTFNFEDAKQIAYANAINYVNEHNLDTKDLTSFARSREGDLENQVKSN